MILQSQNQNQKPVGHCKLIISGKTINTDLHWATLSSLSCLFLHSKRISLYFHVQTWIFLMYQPRHSKCSCQIKNWLKTSSKIHNLESGSSWIETSLPYFRRCSWYFCNKTSRLSRAAAAHDNKDSKGLLNIRSQGSVGGQGEAWHGKGFPFHVFTAALEVPELSKSCSQYQILA